MGPSGLLVVALFYAIVSVTGAISPLSIKGTKFFNAEGDQVFFKGAYTTPCVVNADWVGIAYQRSPYDPFENETQCQLDASLMQKLGANAIRSYHVDPRGNHDGCMKAFSDAGIYLFVDVDTFTTQIEETNPQWTYSQYTAFQAVVDAFAGYDNVAGFFVANEAVTVPNGTDAAPFVKAATRDMKSYMRSKGGRYIPMGYSAADISSIRPMFQNYLVCGPANDTIDFFAVNIYEWCGASSYQTSGYSDRIAELQGYPVPAFFSEDGCIAVRPRTFTDMAAIYGPQMTPILSGTFVYEWIQEANDYGIIEYPDYTSQDGLNVSVGSPVPMQPEFGNLQSQWAAASPSRTSEAAYTPTATGMPCPATTAGTWGISGDQPLPDTPSKDNQNPAYGGSSGTATGTVSSSGTGSSSSSTGKLPYLSMRFTFAGKSSAAKTVAGEHYGPWVALFAACVALGCLV